jgi:hypothetical protein
MSPQSRRSAALALLVATAAAAPARAQDGVAAMCAELAPPEVCDCASADLLGQIGADDFALYDAIGTDYLARMADGVDRGDAWTAASAVVAADAGLSPRQLMDRTNDIGRAHRDAIDACAG